MNKEQDIIKVAINVNKVNIAFILIHFLLTLVFKMAAITILNQIISVILLIISSVVFISLEKVKMKDRYWFIIGPIVAVIMLISGVFVGILAIIPGAIFSNKMIQRKKQTEYLDNHLSNNDGGSETDKEIVSSIKKISLEEFNKLPVQEKKLFPTYTEGLHIVEATPSEIEEMFDFFFADQKRDKLENGETIYLKKDTKFLLTVITREFTYALYQLENHKIGIHLHYTLANRKATIGAWYFSIVTTFLVYSCYWCRRRHRCNNCSYDDACIFGTIGVCSVRSKTQKTNEANEKNFSQ